MRQMFFIADLIACSTCFGHHYAHHQELEGIIQLVVACGFWCLVFKLSVWFAGYSPQTIPTGGDQMYSTLELLMMGISSPQTIPTT
jgi:hypothetical protein